MIYKNLILFIYTLIFISNIQNMGNVCCQTDIENSPLESDIPKVNEYVEATLPFNDPYLEQWMHENNFKIQHHNEHEQIKTMKHKNSERYYYGRWENGVPEGRGLLYEPEKLLFNGDFHKGLPQGRANIKFLDQMCEYEGELKDGRAHGNGTIDNMKQKYRFAGEWEESKPKRGILTFTSDPNISNIQIQDFKSGVGNIIYKDGRKYEGYINTNKLVPNGKGKVTFPYASNKLSYEGDWHNGVMHGKGKFMYTDGSSYDGDYINGKKQGNGTFIFPNGSYYQGYFVAGKQDGAGILYSKNKEQLKKGSWKNGIFQTPLNKDDWARQSRLAEEKASRIKQQVQQQFKRQDEQQKQKLAMSKKSVVSSAQKNQIQRSQQKYYDHSHVDQAGDHIQLSQPKVQSNIDHISNQSKSKFQNNVDHINSQAKAKVQSHISQQSNKIESKVQQQINSQNNKIQSNVQQMSNHTGQKIDSVNQSIKKDSQFGYPTF